MVGHEERVESAALQRLGEALQMREIEIGVREGAGIAPGAGVDVVGRMNAPSRNCRFCVTRSSPRPARGAGRALLNVVSANRRRSAFSLGLSFRMRPLHQLAATVGMIN